MGYSQSYAKASLLARMWRFKMALGIFDIYRIGLSLCVVASVFLLALPSASAQSPQVEINPEDSVKAAILVNLTRFMVWPDEKNKRANTPKTICVASSDPFLQSVLDLRKQDALVPIRLSAKQMKDPVFYKRCEIMHFDHAPPPRQLGHYAEHGILTVGPEPSFLKNGGGVRLHRVNNQMKFSINRAAFETANIVPSSKILTLANEVL